MEVTVSFQYNLNQSAPYESNEVSQVLVRVENTLYGILPEDPWNIEIQLFFRNTSIFLASVSRKTSLFFL